MVLVPAGWEGIEPSCGQTWEWNFPAINRSAPRRCQDTLQRVGKTLSSTSPDNSAPPAWGDTAGFRLATA
jgi:hypothetical protein